MSKAKRGVLLAGGIISLVYSILSLVLGIIGVVALIDIISSGFYETSVESIIMPLVIKIINLVLFIIVLVLSCFLLPNPDTAKKPRNVFKFCIALIVFYSIILILSFVTLDILGILFVIAILTLLIVGICIKRDENKIEVSGNSNIQQTQSSQTSEAPQTNLYFGCDMNDVTDRKIYRIRQLNAEGMINDAEMKELIMEVFKK